MTTPTPEQPPEIGPEMGPEEAERLRRRLAVPTAPAAVLDGARAAAMTAYDEIHADDGRDIRSARRRGAWYQQIPLGAAAAVIAVVALVGIATQVDFGSTEADTATSSGDSSAAFDDSGAAFEADEEAAIDRSADGAGGNGGGVSSAPLTAGGSAVSAYADVDALVDDFGARYGGAQEPTAPPVASTTADASADEGEASANCDVVDVAGVDPTTVVAIEQVSLGPDAVPTSVVVYESTTGLRVSLIDDGSCVVFDDRAL